MKPLPVIFLCTVIVACRFVLCAQQTLQSPVIYSLTEQNGLSDNNVTCFYQDSHGYLWIGTQNGLNRYDGSAFRIFRNKNNAADELAANSVLAITEDRAYHIWIATADGLSMYDPQADTLHTWRVSATDPDINTLNTIAVDSYGDIWLGSFGGLLEFMPASHRFKVFYNSVLAAGPEKRKSNLINYILLDTQQRLWIGSYNGLWRFFPGTAHFEQFIGNGQVPSNDALINKITEDHAGRLWLSFYGNGLQLFDPAQQKLINYFGKENRIPFVKTTTEWKTDSRHFLLNADNLLFDPINKNVYPLYKKNENPDNFIINTAYTSKDNLLWWGTNKGVRIIDPSKQFFHRVLLSDNDITHQGISLLQTRRGIYIGAAGKWFLSVYDSTFALRKSINLAPAIEPNDPFKPSALNIKQENADQLWICTDEGLWHYDEKNSRCEKFHLPKSNQTSPAYDFITNMFIDSKGILWIFPWRNGLWQFDKTNKKFTKVWTGFLQQNNETKNLLIVNAAEDDQGNLWFADLDEGLISYNRANHHFFKPTEKKFGARYSLSNVVFEKPWIWCVSTGKVFRVHTQTMQTEEWSIPDELSSKVYTFCSDHRGHLWITTRKGLLSFNTHTFHFKRYTTGDGLLDNDLTEPIWCLDNGNIVYTAHRYLLWFNPADLDKPSATPPVQLTAVFSQNKRLPVSVNSKGEKTLDLSYTYNNFTFNWGMQHYSNPLQNQYYYQLMGIDDGWKYAGNKGIAVYAGLSPGKYIFRMNGAPNDGIMSSNGDYLVITIHPPFWKTAWFITSFTLLSLGALIVIVSYIARRNLKEKLLNLEKEQALEKERNRISRDMHDELGSGLTKIAILSEVVKKQLNEPEKAKQQLENISASSRELVDNLQNIIWVLNPKNDSLESLSAYVREYALKFFEPFGIDVIFHYQENLSVKLSEETRHHLFLIIKETFNNIARHAWCNTVTISIRQQADRLELVIEDDGKGFDQNKIRTFGNGIRNMKNRISQVGGIYQIESAPGKGAKTSILVPC